MHAVVLLQSERCQDLIWGRRIWQVARDENERRSALGWNGGHADIGRIDRVATAAARRLTIIGAEKFCHRCHPGKLCDFRYGSEGVQKGIEAVGGNKPWKRRLR